MNAQPFPQVPGVDAPSRAGITLIGDLALPVPRFLGFTQPLWWLFRPALLFGLIYFAVTHEVFADFRHGLKGHAG